jgi:hypothetical protein
MKEHYSRCLMPQGSTPVSPILARPRCSSARGNRTLELAVLDGQLSRNGRRCLVDGDLERCPRLGALLNYCHV